MQIELNHLKWLLCKQIRSTKDLLIMIFNSRLLYSISHLSYAPNTIPLLQKYQQTSNNDSFKLLSFNNPAKYPSLMHRFVKSKPHAQLFQLYIKFITLGQEKPTEIAYQSIQGNLRNIILSELRKKQIKLTVQRCKILESTLLQQKQFRGVFIHRNLNLDSNSYEVKVNRNGSVSFDLKKSLRFQSIQEYQRIVREYEKDKLKDIYCQSFDEFQKNKEIKRYLYRFVTDLTISIDQKGRSKVLLGQKQPTQHILQIQSVFNPYYQMEQFFLTDIDFLLNGNYFLRTKFY